jgi:hypothetical protein
LREHDGIETNGKRGQRIQHVRLRLVCFRQPTFRIFGVAANREIGVAKRGPLVVNLGR